MAANCQTPGIECGLVSQSEDDDVLPTNHGHDMLFTVPVERRINATKVFQRINS